MRRGCIVGLGLAGVVSRHWLRVHTNTFWGVLEMYAHKKLIAAMLEETKDKHFEKNQWGIRHCEAWQLPHSAERGIVRLIQALAEYADCYRIKWGQGIQEDGYAMPEWESMLRSANRLLSMEIGRLDGGTLSSLLNAMAKEERTEL